MSRCVVLTNTSDVKVYALVNYIFIFFNISNKLDSKMYNFAGNILD